MAASKQAQLVEAYRTLLASPQAKSPKPELADLPRLLKPEAPLDLPPEAAGLEEARAALGRLSGQLPKDLKGRRKVERELGSVLREFRERTGAAVGPREVTRGEVAVGFDDGPWPDERLGPVPGVPSESEIRTGAGSLGATDQDTFDKVRDLLARHLGSYAAARLWLTTPRVAGLPGTPLEAIREGRVNQVLAALESQWGPNPSYA